jgi:hypothetical protein
MVQTVASRCRLARAGESGTFAVTHEVRSARMSDPAKWALGPLCTCHPPRRGKHRRIVKTAARAAPGGHPQWSAYHAPPLLPPCLSVCAHKRLNIFAGAYVILAICPGWAGSCDFEKNLQQIRFVQGGVLVLCAQTCNILTHFNPPSSISGYCGQARLRRDEHATYVGLLCRGL